MSVRRDMDLVRKIAMELGDSQHELEASLFCDERHDYQDVAHHMAMMEEAGLITVRKQAGDGAWAYCAAVNLTWAGNEFLAAASNDKVWRRTMLEAAKAAGGATLPLFMRLLEKALEAKLGLS